MLAVWLFAIGSAVASACVAHAVHLATDDRMSVSHGHTGDETAPSDCERFCDGDATLPAKTSSTDDPSGAVAIGIVSMAPALRIVALVDTAAANGRSPARDPAVPVLLQSSRLAL